MDADKFARVDSRLSPELRDQSRECASIMGLKELTAYGSFAIRLLNQASANGFSTQKTLFDTGARDSDGEIYTIIPTLVDNSRGTSDRSFTLIGPIQDKRELEMYAERSRISPAERVRRSLRFANFIVTNDKSVLSNAFRRYHFLHEGEDVWLRG